MADFKLNSLIKQKQYRVFLVTIFGITLLAVIVITLCIDKKPKKNIKKINPQFNNVVDELFTERNVESSMIAQQNELTALKQSVADLKDVITTLKNSQTEKLENLNKYWQEQINEAQAVALSAVQKVREPIVNNVINQIGTHPNIHTVTFKKKHQSIKNLHLDPSHYVPSNTSVRAVVLGGVDADASVNGQSKNNGVMLFKLLDPGNLPNGQRSRLQGCRVSANTYGDISSERAFATLYRLSCAHPGQPILDKEVTGWVFYNGKAGIKGKPLMRDNKVMQWAGISGALSGVAQAAQYAQSVQQISGYGATSIVPSGNIAPFAAYGGASKAADKLSEYYVQRAEQYHPVIQIGSGNIVTIVFKDGFSLDPEPKNQQQNEEQAKNLEDFDVPPEVLNQVGATK